MKVEVVAVVVLPLGFVVAEMNVPNGSPVRRCCSWHQLVVELMNWMS